MVFSSLQFFAFFGSLIIIMKLLKANKPKKVVLLAASIFFYAYWDLRFVFLLFLLALINFVIGRHLETKNFIILSKKRLLTIGIIINIFTLGVFKYFNFFINNANLILNNWGFDIKTLNIILPLGISFFVFELISYLVDVYYGKIEHTSDMLDFLTFVFFFPRLASGPIIRPADFLPQLSSDILINKKNFIIGIQIFALGLFKKLIVADTLATYIDAVFLAPDIFNSLTIWLAVLAYSIQIYCDFSGYSDMAIGVAKILGFNLPVNFNMPYISLNVSEFWKRWHISLSSWLRDYLYIPLGGNKKGIQRTNINLMITMILGGLWHGASWNFVFWGGLHGMALIIHKYYSSLCSNIEYTKYKTYKLLSWLGTYIFVCICWVFFRANSFGTSLTILGKMFKPSTGVMWIYPQLLVITAVVLAVTRIKDIYSKNSNSYGYITFDMKNIAEIFLFLLSLLFIFFMGADNTSPFIYFQF